MNVWPLRFREVGDEGLLFTDEAGSYFTSDAEFLERYAHGRLSTSDKSFLKRNGHAGNDEGFEFSAFAYRYSRRLFVPSGLGYVILVPTLRCNLACDYCQVARTGLSAKGFDWTEETLERVLGYLDGLSSRQMKIEFQGGEPLVRLDLLQKVRSFCRERFEKPEFVVCTNLQEVSEEAWRFLEDADTSVSTSLDGDMVTHRRQRTKEDAIHDRFAANLREALHRLSGERVSAIATLDPDRAPDPQAVVDTFHGLGMRSVYARPVNHQGFARKRFPADRDAIWNAFYGKLIDALIEHNSKGHEPMEEYYFTHCLRRVVRGAHDNHVDLRNPNLLGADYVVVDYDGRLYPTDEARMVTRVGQADLSIGDVAAGIDKGKIECLNWNSLNSFHEDCVHCAFQPFCGLDLVDDISRYGRIDLPKHATSHCRRHLAVFDKVFEVIYSRNPAVRRSAALWLGVPEFPDGLARVHR